MTVGPQHLVEEVRPWVEDLYRHFHEHPELSMQEEATAERVHAELLEWVGDADLEVVGELGGHGIAAVVRNGEGPVVLLRADMDALPVREESGLPYASTVEVADAEGRRVPVMHACGHDAHTACLLGAYRVLCARLEDWSGTVIFLFQPAEEAYNGAEAVVASGLVERVPRPDVAFGQHVLPGPAGTLWMWPGAAFSGADDVRITLRGRGGHASTPHLAVDPIVMAASLVLRLQTIVAREVPPDQTAVVTVGSVHAGTKSNIIPAEAVLDLTVRTYDKGVRDHILEAIRRRVEAETLAVGAPPADIEVYDSLPVTVNDGETVRRLRAHLARALPDVTVRESDPMGGSEDFGVVPDAFGTPYVYWGLAGFDPDAWTRSEEAGTQDDDFPSPHESSFVPVLQPTLDTGVSALVAATLGWVGRTDG